MHPCDGAKSRAGCRSRKGPLQATVIASPLRFFVMPDRPILEHPSFWAESASLASPIPDADETITLFSGIAAEPAPLVEYALELARSRMAPAQSKVSP